MTVACPQDALRVEEMSLSSEVKIKYLHCSKTDFVLQVVEEQIIISFFP
jgi:hypothetical protein